MKHLLFRAPASGGTLLDLLTRACPTLDPRQLLRPLRQRSILVDGAAVEQAKVYVPAGALVAATIPDASDRSPPPVDILLRTADYCVVDKPAGWSSEELVDAIALQLDHPRDQLGPAHHLDEEVGGAWLIGLTPEGITQYRDAFRSGAARVEYRALVPVLPWPQGTFRAGIAGKPAETTFSTLHRFDDFTEIQLIPVAEHRHQVRRHLADAQSPIVGDSLFGGILVAGGLRLRSHRIVVDGEPLDAAVAPLHSFSLDKPLYPRTSPPPTVRVSSGTVSAMKRGHPWVLADAETSDVGRFSPGTIVVVRSHRDDELGLGRIEGEGEGRIAVREWSPPTTRSATVEERIAQAVEKRARQFAGREDETNAYRVIHGEADRFPGIAIDRLGDELRLITFGRACDPLLPNLVADVAKQIDGVRSGVVVRHLARQTKGDFLSVWPVFGEPRREPFVVVERRLRFEVTNGTAEPMRSRPGVGLFLDQRSNRDRVARHIEQNHGGRWLNLFCHTGAFTVAAIAAGADHVTSVDISRPYLETLERNLRLNDLDVERHRSVKGDSQHFVSKLDRSDRFDGIILDPPTAAAAGRKFWSARKQLAAMLEQLFTHLSPRGVLLVCRNDHHDKTSLRRQVEEASQRSRVRVADIAPAPPSPDFPRRRGFPEGDAFEGILVTLQ